MKGEAFTTWSSSAVKKGVWEVVSPADGVAVDAAKNKRAMAQLLGALSEDILMSVLMKKMAKEVWDSLKTRFIGAVL
ncbi:hypothetical protein QYE76_057770 [Lolium multiflorum]|uniref:Uncharacterized protein n=1 Tax=Lolium multiflorum TaxID=4521 RepID=A0AAD8WPC9_LOLMU|nr:hypothetical protein QYE76_057770 [Lolium multiflorum]